MAGLLILIRLLSIAILINKLITNNLRGGNLG